MAGLSTSNKKKSRQAVAWRDFLFGGIKKGRPAFKQDPLQSGDGEHISLLIYQRFKAFCPQFVRRLSDQLGQLVDDQTVILGFDLINQIRVRFECNRDI